MSVPRSPRVTLWAHTRITDALRARLEQQDGVTDADHLAEAAGRACYLSWHRPNPVTATTAGYLEHIVKVEHFSLFSHASATFYLEGVSRSLALELIRSRWLAFSQVSQRYVDESGFAAIVPPALVALTGWRRLLARTVLGVQVASSRLAYRALVALLTPVFATLPRSDARKRAREAARAVLPNAAATSIVVSGNVRAWRDFLAQRLAEGADAEIRRLALELLEELVVLAPESLADIAAEYGVALPAAAVAA